jgi:hypothetical protein
MKPSDFPHSDDYAKAFTAAHPGFYPTYFSSFQCGWIITRETEKAVLLDYVHWIPKSVCLIEAGKVIGVKSAFYARLNRNAIRRIA